MDSFSYFTRLDCIELSNHEALIADLLEALIENAYHLVSVLLVDIAKPVLDFQTNDLLHHALM